MRGAFTTIACSGLALAACSTPSVRVRAIADPAARLRGAGDALAEARTMLALNSVGLALEGFHRVAIDQPSNPAVYVGMAQCYAAMGRYDLESTNYEKALAYAPHDRTILAAYAISLERQGEITRAAQVRTELALAVAPAMQAPQTGTLTIKLPAARPVSMAAAQPIAPKPSAAPSEHAKYLAASETPSRNPITAQDATVDVVVRPLRVTDAHSSVDLAAQAAAALPVAVQTAVSTDFAATPSLKPEIAAASVPSSRPLRASRLPALTFAESLPGSMTMAALPVITPGRPYVPAKAAPNTAALAAQVAAMEPLIKPRELIHATEQLRSPGSPRLERLSISEVALVTTQMPVWRTNIASVSRPPVAVQWLPIRTAEARPAIQLLNAARSQGLAARTRIALADRGWRRMRIGDYREVRMHSLVLYSSQDAPMGRRLAAQFDCKAIEVKGKRVLVVLIGRDATSRKAASSRA